MLLIILPVLQASATLPSASRTLMTNRLPSHTRVSADFQRTPS